MKRKTIIVSAIAFMVCFVGFSYMMSRPDRVGNIDTTLKMNGLFFFMVSLPSFFIACFTAAAFGDKQDKYDC